ncbi:hypothetical protein [Mucilaginibacter sp. 22184]|uniref:hypothetical protein n=1 Tax=Mucilaginibacter sp. 22184 TaxID=3453887 RepID=UPI003F850BD9
MYNKIDYPVVSYDNNSMRSPNYSDINYGQVVERVVRRDPIGISELARRLNVSRRTIYNWFETEKLSFDIICKIGFVIGHDFSDELPEDFAQKSNNATEESFTEIKNGTEQPPNAIYYWMDRYIKLLEKFNETLSHEMKDHDSHSDNAWNR